jgi:hypothetical protein
MEGQSVGGSDEGLDSGLGTSARSAAKKGKGAERVGCREERFGDCIPADKVDFSTTTRGGSLR